MIKQRFKIPLYFGTFLVVCADDLQEAADKMGIGVDMGGFEAAAYKRTRHKGEKIRVVKEYVILMSRDTSPASIAHESLHVVNYVLAAAGVTPDFDNDEPACYLMGWIFNKAHTVWERAQNQPTK